MKKSKFVADVVVNDRTRLLYNSIEKKYYEYDTTEKKYIEDLLKNINRGEYSPEDISVICELLSKRIIISDDMNEMDYLAYKENQIRYQSDTFHIMILVTNGCNFRCEYCVQEHANVSLTDSSADKIISLIRNRAKQVKRVKITWFGGEPLLQYKRINQMMEDIIEIGEQFNCIIEAGIVSNGFLLNQEMIKRFKKLHVNMMQITLDGDRETHNKRRYLSNGEETYDTVVHNIQILLENEIPVLLRINIDENSYQSATDVLDIIPKEYRGMVSVSVSNFYQTEKKVSPYEIYKKAIKMGYRYPNRFNVFMACQTCLMNGIIVDASGDLIICANADKEDKKLGFIDADGNIRIQNSAVYYKLKTVSALQNPACKECEQLPFCIGTCKYGRYKNNDKCIGMKNDGLTIQELAKLDYLYDKNS